VIGLYELLGNPTTELMKGLVSFSSWSTAFILGHSEQNNKVVFHYFIPVARSEIRLHKSKVWNLVISKKFLNNLWCGCKIQEFLNRYYTI
jgi:hypothetical protein